MTTETAKEVARHWADLVAKCPQWPHNLVEKGWDAIHRQDFRALDAILARLDKLPRR